MNFRDMSEANELINQNYRDEVITREEWLTASVALHSAYIESNNLKTRCVCICCNEMAR